jgi:hypothetical protein
MKITFDSERHTWEIEDADLPEGKVVVFDRLEMFRYMEKFFGVSTRDES